ncbi:MAG: DHHA1 domain-containing protein [Erysipelotrichaceae bacterium]
MINHLLDDCFASELNSEVIEVIEENGRYWHAFKETIFFKESGGMSSDVGAINNNEVLDLKEEAGKLWHLLDVKLEGKVHLSVNLHVRFRKCQIHTTQHLISALLHNVYNVETLSHHVGEDENDIEFNFESFSDKQSSELQILCNGLIRDDLKVNILYPTHAEALKINPKALMKQDQLRVVTIANLDYNLCGCMHVPSLRYIQLIKVLGYEKTKKGYKIKYICGDQLLDCMSRRYHVLDEASKSLALSHMYINTGINKLVNEVKSLGGDLVVWKQKYYELEGHILGNMDETLIVKEYHDIDVKSLSALAHYVVSNYDKVVVLIAKVYDSCHIVIASNQSIDFDCESVFKDISKKFKLKGSGNQYMAQGGGMYSSAILEYINSVTKD